MTFRVTTEIHVPPPKRPPQTDISCGKVVVSFAEWSNFPEWVVGAVTYVSGVVPCVTVKSCDSLYPPGRRGEGHGFPKKRTDSSEGKRRPPTWSRRPQDSWATPSPSSPGGTTYTFRQFRSTRPTTGGDADPESPVTILGCTSLIRRSVSSLYLPHRSTKICVEVGGLVETTEVEVVGSPRV